MRKLTHKQNMITMGMMADIRLPRKAFGYVSDIQSPECSATVLADRLNQLKKYVPELVKEFITQEKEG